MSGANLKFYQDFQASVAGLEAEIEGLASASLRQEAIDGIRASISRLSNELADASEYLPTYDQKSYAEASFKPLAIKGLNDRLDKEVDKVAPRPRFQFKARSKPAQNVRDDRRILGKPPISEQPSLSPSSSQSASQPQKDYNATLRTPSTLVKKPSFSSAKTVSLTSLKDLHVVLPPSASSATAYGDLSDLESCVVDMSVPARGETPFSGLALKGMRRCIVVTGNVEGAVHVTGIRDAVLVVASRQVRIHECEGVDFYLHCSSHPIIEDCRNVRFAPIPGYYTPPWSETHENQWDQVDDFKWLKTDHSPNWSILPEGKRLDGDFWTEDVAGKTEVGVQEIFKKAGIIS